MPLDSWSVFTANFGGLPKPCTAFVTLVDMAIYFVIIANVSRSRVQHKIKAPSIEGPETFQRVLRVQVNTVEQLTLHLPILWIAAFAMDDVFAASFGILWALGRVLYARGYYQKPKRRTKGFVIGMVVNAILFVGALAGTVASF